MISTRLTRKDAETFAVRSVSRKPHSLVLLAFDGAWNIFTSFTGNYRTSVARTRGRRATHDGEKMLRIPLSRYNAPQVCPKRINRARVIASSARSSVSQFSLSLSLYVSAIPQTCYNLQSPTTPPIHSKARTVEVSANGRTDVRMNERAHAMTRRVCYTTCTFPSGAGIFSQLRKF